MIPELSAQQQSAAVVLAGLTGLCWSANAILGVFQKLESIRQMRNPTRVPPLGEESAKTYATKTDTASLRIEVRDQCVARHQTIDGTLKEIFGILRETSTRQGEWQRSVAQQLGRIDGCVETIKREVFKDEK